MNNVFTLFCCPECLKCGGNKREWRKFIKVCSYLMELTEINSKALWKCDLAALHPSPFQTTQSGAVTLVLQDH